MYQKAPQSEHIILLGLRKGHVKEFDKRGLGKFVCLGRNI